MKVSWPKGLLPGAKRLLGRYQYVLLVMAVEVCLLLDDEPLFDVLRPLNILNPIWMTVGGIFLAGALVLAIIARVRFNKLVVRQ